MHIFAAPSSFNKRAENNGAMQRKAAMKPDRWREIVPLTMLYPASSLYRYIETSSPGRPTVGDLDNARPSSIGIHC